MSIERETQIAPVESLPTGQLSEVSPIERLPERVSAGLPDDVTDAELWSLVQTVRSRHQREDEAETCGFCAEAWPCQAEQLAMVADVASRMSRSLPRSA
jgi:hypothetical protein